MPVHPGPLLIVSETEFLKERNGVLLRYISNVQNCVQSFYLSATQTTLIRTPVK